MPKFDFLHNIFSRGAYGSTADPVVSIGGLDNTSSSLTYDVAHFSGGALIVFSQNGGGGGSSGTFTSNVVASQSGSWTVAISSISGTPAFNIAQWGGSNVQSASFGEPLVGWGQRLDASNDAVQSYGSARTSDIAGLMAASGSNIPMICDSLGKQVVLPGAVNDLHLDGAVANPGVLSTVLIPTPGAGKKIAVQSLLVTGSASALANVIITGGLNNRTFGLIPVGYGGFQCAAGGAPVYITSASISLGVFTDSTVTCNIFASGYSMSN